MHHVQPFADVGRDRLYDGYVNSDDLYEES